ncbi:hypothetical protein BTJ49_02490 [Oleiagrimonas sp. MCCC 1A03011]|nr:hypothetical protein BTJ49_02490 [Oleiagrimonas sp. MCCC 1A03011]
MYVSIQIEFDIELAFITMADRRKIMQATVGQDTSAAPVIRYSELSSHRSGQETQVSRIRRVIPNRARSYGNEAPLFQLVRILAVDLTRHDAPKRAGGAIGHLIALHDAISLSNTMNEVRE